MKILLLNMEKAFMYMSPIESTIFYTSKHVNTLPKSVCNKIYHITKNSGTNKCNFFFLFPPWKKKLLKLEVKDLHFSFPFKVCLSPTFHPEEGYLLCLSLIFEDFLRPVKWCRKNKRI